MMFWAAKLRTATGGIPALRPLQARLARAEHWVATTGLAAGDLVFLTSLLAAAIWIWIRDLAWLSAYEETVPILAAVPLFVWLGAPWRFRAGPWTLARRPLCVVAVLTGAGVLLDLTILLAAAWTLLLWCWIQKRALGNLRLLNRLAILPALAFPWVSLDLAPVGWWFRLSAAWVADHAYIMSGFSVVREGTNLLVNGIPIEVAAPCSGMNSLQAILMGGLVLTWIEFGKSRSYWWMVASLPVLAWVANTVRVCSIIAMAVGFGPDAARGTWHQIGGWAAVLAVIALWSLTAKSLAGARHSRSTKATGNL